MAATHPEARFFRSDSAERLWQRYCGFLDLSTEQFMEIQQYLLQEQLKQVSDTPIGRAIMGGAHPASMAEFRKTVPLTTYQDYAPFLDDRREDALGERPYFWCHSAGRGGRFKWIPYTKAAFDNIAKHGIAVGILAGASERGQVNVETGQRVLVNLAPRPYASGSLMHHLADYFPYRPVPSLADAENLDFRERTKAAFKQGLDEGIDYIFSASTVLVKIGNSFRDHGKGLSIWGALKHPRAFRRLAQAWVRSKAAGRPMMPRDLWNVKGLVTFGVDSTIYEQEIHRLWGKVPYQVYGTTEMMIGAVQSWNKRWMTFLPDVAFWEFIPQAEYERSRRDPAYQPTTVLMDELRVGEQYELVYSHFHGMPLLRYRIGDVVKVMALEDKETGVRLPQVVYQARASDIIDLAGLTQIDERTLWTAIAETGVHYEEWTARKEYDNGAGQLRLYVELLNGDSPQQLEEGLEQQLRRLDADYRDLEGWLGQQRTVAVTALSPGTFGRYLDEQLRDRVPLAQVKPSHINPSPAAVTRLLEISATFARQEMATPTPVGRGMNGHR